MKKQIDKSAYNFQRYYTIERWGSYWHQINEILNCQPANVLEVGAGNRIVGNYLAGNTSVDYKSLDIAEDLNPDIIGNVEKMSLQDNSFDVVCAFEVLEHLPFEKFARCLKEIRRVSAKYALISLPHWGRHFSFSFHLPYFKKIKWQYKINLFSIKHKFNGQHYWEIGKKNYSLIKIKSLIKNNGFKIEKDYVCFESPYHHFFVLKK